jgi:hypothetical protein
MLCNGYAVGPKAHCAGAGLLYKLAALMVMVFGVGRRALQQELPAEKNRACDRRHGGGYLFFES